MTDSKVLSIADLCLWNGTEPPVVTPVSPEAKDMFGDNPFIPIGDIVHLIEALPTDFVLRETQNEPTEKISLHFIDRVLQ